MSLRALGIAAVTLLVALGVFSAFVGIHFSPSGAGTLLLELSSKSGDSIGDTQIEVHTARDVKEDVKRKTKAKRGIECVRSPGEHRHDV